MDITILIGKIKEAMHEWFPFKSEIPTKTSDLIDDIGFVKTTQLPLFSYTINTLHGGYSDGNGNHDLPDNSGTIIYFDHLPSHRHARAYLSFTATANTQYYFYESEGNFLQSIDSPPFVVSSPGNVNIELYNGYLRVSSATNQKVIITLDLF